MSPGQNPPSNNEKNIQSYYIFYILMVTLKITEGINLTHIYIKKNDKN